MKTKLKLTRAVMAALVFVFIITGISIAGSNQLKLDAAMDKHFLLADTGQTAYLRVALTGFAMDEPLLRAPVNIAIVIDKSGSMNGEKITKAREAAIMAIDRLNSNDLISVVTYDSNVHVLIPATKVSDKEAIFSAIRNIQAGGSTALFAGVSKGAKEMRKFLSSDRVNRMLLLSDGLANVGPQTPRELGNLGTSLIKDGISVTTIGVGLGYNEDLMTQLAYKSDGSHYFAEEPEDLARIFDSELGKALSVVAQEIQIKIKCAPSIRPVRLLGRQGKINGQNVSVLINQLYREHTKYAILEVEVPSTAENKTRKIATVSVNYGNMKTHTTDKLSSTLKAKFTNSKELVEKRTNRDVMVDVIEQIAAERNELAVKLRDKGEIHKARQVLKENAGYLKSNADRYDSRRLAGQSGKNEEDADNLDEKNWSRQRKSMREAQSEVKSQR